MTILLKNATLISMSDKREKLESNMDLIIEEGKIKKIGKKLSYQADKVINIEGNILMPGLINTHAHVPMSLFRDTLDGYTLQQWLSDKIWPMEDRLTKQDVYLASYLSYLEMIQTGTTTIHDMYFTTEQIVEAALDTGIRLQTTRTLMGEGKEGEERIKELEDLIHTYQKEDTITFDVGVHGLYTTNAQYLEKCKELAEKYQLPIHIHFCENEQEVNDIKKIYNMENPVEVLEKYLGNQRYLLAHVVKVTKQQIEQLAQFRQVSVSHCPISNLKLGCGNAPITTMLEKGINVSLGTDGQGSGSNLDLFQVMKFTALLQKGITENPTVLPAYEVLKMATINGAKALGLEDNIGSIEEGKEADMIEVTLNSMTVKPTSNLFSDLVYNVSPEQVTMVMVNGKVLKEEGRLIQGKIEEKIREGQEIIKRIGKGILED